MNVFRCHQCGVTTNGTDASGMKYDWDFSATETRHNALMNSNEAPLDSDISIAQSALEKADARLASLDAEMSRIREQLRQLEAEHSALEIYRTKNKAILSPLRRMPPELLSEIFSWTLPPAKNAAFHPGFDITDSPWGLTHVSSQWRSIAISNPSFWSLVVVVYTPDITPSSSYALSMVETQIARAKSLKIHFYGCEDTDPGPQIDTFRCLAKHAPRWEDLDLELTSALFPLLAGLRGRMTSLRRLWLQWESPESQIAAESDPSNQSIDFCATAPSLVDFGVLCQRRFIPLPLQAHNLTRYQSNAPWETHRRVLKQAPNLIEAQISTNGDPVPANDEIIDLPSLLRLFVSPSDILQFLRFPCLEQLGIECDKKDGSSVHHFQSALVRSSCPLRSLCFDGTLHTPTITTILQGCSTLTALVILAHSDAAGQVAKKLMQDLIISAVDGGTVVAPQLSRIWVGCVGQSEVHPGGFLDMVQSRWDAGKGALRLAMLLRNSTGVPRAKISRSDRLRIGALREEGLNLLFLKDLAAANAIDKWHCSAQWT
ncbi:hypothetical protein C8R47DRAFT_200 [Mycena vitilis]|nr:hypothetical protein C8R47DRAFT_200 [Mycena vitilis]